MSKKSRLILGEIIIFLALLTLVLTLNAQTLTVYGDDIELTEQFIPAGDKPNQWETSLWKACSRFGKQVPAKTKEFTLSMKTETATWYWIIKYDEGVYKMLHNNTVTVSCTNVSYLRQKIACDAFYLLTGVKKLPKEVGS